MREIAPNVYIETSYSHVTVGAVLTGGGWLIIDTPPMPKDAEAFLAELKIISNKPAAYVVNTDAHRDRILGNSWFNAPVVAHSIAAYQMLDLKPAFISNAADELSTNDNELVAIASLPLTTAQISYSETLTLSMQDREILLVQKTGSSAGTTWIVLGPEKVIFAGDSVVSQQHPVILEGETKNWLETLYELRTDRYKDWTIVPGRGEPIAPQQTETLSEYLRIARRKIRSLVRTGNSRSDITTLIPEFLDLFPYEPRSRDAIQKRVKAGLEVIYDEMRSLEDKEEEADPEEGE